jgi:hypothetical protein
MRRITEGRFAPAFLFADFGWRAAQTAGTPFSFQAFNAARMRTQERMPLW